MQTEVPCFIPAFFFVLEKAVKSAENAVIPTFPTRWSYGLQHLRHKRRNVRFEGLRRVHTPPQPLTAHTAAHTVKQGCFGRGWYHYPRSVPHVHKHPRAGYQKGVYFAAFGSWPGVLPKNEKSLRSSDALMRVVAPRRRGPAGLRDLFAIW